MISRRTLNTHLVNVVQAFKWAEAHYKSVPKITAGKLLLPIKKRPDESRKAFSQSDLDVLFGTKFAALPDHKKWLLRLGLYTGARIEEICQLDLTKDVYQDEGVWVLDFNDLDDKNLKTAASKRKVPIHPKLIDLGLLSYFEKVKRPGRNRPFPEWEPYRGKFSKNASKWFGRTYKKVSCGITDPLKTFHSIRHTVLDQLKQRGVYEGHAAAIAGQTYHGITYATYGKQYSSKLLLEEIAKLEFKLPND